MYFLPCTLLRLILIFSVVAATSAVAAAGQVTYSSLPLPVPDTRPADLAAANSVQSTFLAALSSSGTETLDELAGSPILGQGNPTLTFGASGITAATTYSGAFSVPVLPVSAPIALVEQPAANGAPPWTNMMTFSSPVTAFGSYFIQAGDVLANTVTLRFENTSLGTSKDVVMGTIGPGASFSNVFYFGVTDTDPFNRVTLLPSNNGDGILLDNITIGTVAVPEPSALLLLAMGAWPLFLARVVRRAKPPR